MKSNDLAGKWKIEREVCDPSGRLQSRMQGVGNFLLLEPDELIYQEQLWHETKGNQLLFATKFYRYLFKENSIEVYFHQEEENRLFMILPIGREMVGTSKCKEDRYHLKWDWINEDQFLTLYSIKGPKKDYKIESRFSR